MAATPIPALVSQVLVDSDTNSVQVAGGSAQTLASTRSYYLLSDVSGTSEGQSLLRAIRLALTASKPTDGTHAYAWVVDFTSTYRVRISHDAAASSPANVTLSTGLATRLGFSSGVITFSSHVATAPNRSRWFWSPDKPVSDTGPVRFDPELRHACFSSAGGMSRSSDMTTAAITNGEQGEAEYLFAGVQYDYKIHPQANYANEDLEGFWFNALRYGNKLLWWRDRDRLLASGDGNGGDPPAGSAPNYYYVEYVPQSALRERPLFEPVAEGNLCYWNVRFPLWLTERYAGLLGAETSLGG
jgi:hypothetical protein